MPAVNPQILKWARETAGLSLEEAAHKIGLKDSKKQMAYEKLQSLENGEREPSQRLLFTLAEKYNRPLLMFYLKAPPRKGDLGEDFRVLSSSPAVSSDSPEVDVLIRKVKLQQSLAKSLVEEELDSPLPFIASLKMDDGVEAVARSITHTLSFDLETFQAQRSAEDAFKYVRNQIERVGIFILLYNHSGNPKKTLPLELFRGFAIADPVAPFIVINSEDAKAAMSFTAFHEVAHLWIGASGISNLSAERDIERFCNDVASEILLPVEVLNSFIRFNQASLDIKEIEITNLADSLNISRTMIAYNLFRKGFLKKDEWNFLRNQFYAQWEGEKKRKKDAKTTSGPSYYVTSKYRLGTAILQLASSALHEGTLTYTKAGQLLGVRPRNIPKLLEGIG